MHIYAHSPFSFFGPSNISEGPSFEVLPYMLNLSVVAISVVDTVVDTE